MAKKRIPHHKTPRKPTGVFTRGHNVTIRMKVEYTTTYRALQIPREVTQTMLDQHAEALLRARITNGIHSSEYALDTRLGSIEITVATDFSKSTTFVGLSSDFS